MIMLAVEKRKGSLKEIAKRAEMRKTNPSLRHVPSENDLRIASEHAQIMVYHQYQTIKTTEEDK